MNIKEFKELVNSIPDEYDDSEVYMRFANGDYDNRHYTVSSVIPMAILGCSGTNHLAIGCTSTFYGLKYNFEENCTFYNAYPWHVKYEKLEV